MILACEISTGSSDGDRMDRHAGLRSAELEKSRKDSEEVLRQTQPNA